jgi:hypothetical protein
MANISLSATGGPPGHDAPKCPFCKETTLLNYRTKFGEEKDEGKLRTNLAASGQITNDGGPIFPIAGANDKTKGWTADAGVFEDFEVEMAAAPHHIIPGNTAMKRSKVESWTRKSKGKIKQDIGYDIDGAPNGVFLPHLPEIYFTRRIETGMWDDAAGDFVTQSVTMAKGYGQSWGDNKKKKQKGLSANAKESIVYTIMLETSLQAHFSDHDASYIHTDAAMTYDLDCQRECDQLDDLMKLKSQLCPQKSNPKPSFNPPYSLVGLINGKSAEVLTRITGRPKKWSSWISAAAHQLTFDIESGKVRDSFKGVIHRIT